MCSECHVRQICPNLYGYVCTVVRIICTYMYTSTPTCTCTSIWNVHTVHTYLFFDVAVKISCDHKTLRAALTVIESAQQKVGVNFFSRCSAYGETFSKMYYTCDQYVICHQESTRLSALERYFGGALIVM